MKKLIIILSLSLAGAATVFAGEPVIDSKASLSEEPPALWDPHRPDSHAPIGVMGDHTHETGEFMFSYRFMTMFMGNNYLGDTKVADSRVVSPTGEGFLVTPTEMTTDMHMLGAMVAPSDQITLMLMAPFVNKSMDHLRRDGVRFRTGSDGIGDLKLSSLVKLFDQDHQRAHFHFGISFPTGATDAEDFIPGPGVTRLPYPMQLGSGTWDLLPGLTWLGQSGNLSWGAQALANLRLGTNGEGYQLGDVYTGNLWAAYRLCECASASARVSGSSWGNIKGSDRNLAIPPMAVPTADPRLRGGDRIDVFGGLNWYGRNGIVRGHRLAIEAGGTVWQDLDGPQLGMDWMLLVGWQKAF